LDERAKHWQQQNTAKTDRQAATLSSAFQSNLMYENRGNLEDELLFKR
jgi:hypothetical protein